MLADKIFAIGFCCCTFWAFCIAVEKSIIVDLGEGESELKTATGLLDRGSKDFGGTNSEQWEVVLAEKNAARNQAHRSDFSLGSESSSKRLKTHSESVTKTHLDDEKVKHKRKMVVDGYKNVVKSFIDLTQKVDEKMDIEMLNELRLTLKLLGVYIFSHPELDVVPNIEGLGSNCSTYVVDERFRKMIVDGFEKVFSLDYLAIDKSKHSLVASPVIPLIFELLTFIQKSGIRSHKTLESIFSGEKAIESFSQYIFLLIHEKWGFIGIFQTCDIQDFLLSHPELAHVRSILESLSKDQWKGMEFRFLYSHLFWWYNKDLNYSLFQESEELLFKHFFWKISSSSEFDANWLKLFNFEVLPDSCLYCFLEQKVFFYHVLKYIKKYFPEANFGNLIEEQMKFFGGVMNQIQTVFQYSDTFSYQKAIRKYSLEPYSELFSRLSRRKSTKISKIDSGNPHCSHVKYNGYGSVCVYWPNFSEGLAYFHKEITENSEQMEKNYDKFESLWDLEGHESYGELKIWSRSPELTELKEVIFETREFYRFLATKPIKVKGRRKLKN